METLVHARRVARRTAPTRVRNDDYFQFEGGLNLVDPPLEVRPGQLLACRNYEPGVRGGYTRIGGFERFDGRSPKPSEATYSILNFDAGTVGNYPSVGDTVTGGTSGATGELLAAVVDDDSDGVGYLVLGRISGTFQDDETLQAPGPTNFATADGTPVVEGADTDALNDTYRVLAEADARTQIQKVPGEGRIRGVVVYNGNVYAWRNNVGSTQCDMFKSTSSGWSQITPSPYLDFDAGTAAFVEGETLTGGTSGATATILRVVVETGAFGTSDADGYLVLSGITGTFQNNETITSASGSATSDGTVQNPTFPANGRYEFRIRNFYGHSGSRRIYGVNGVGNAFEFDDSPEMLVFIRTGMTTDTPNHLGVHDNFLWLSFPGGSIQRSSVGVPVEWSPVLGASELGIGDECTGFLEEVGTTMFVFGESETKYLTGDPSSGYALKNYSIEQGSRPWSIQRIAQGVYLSDIGLTTLATSDRFGNYLANTFSEKIQPLLQDELRILAVDSMIVRQKNLYRIFFSDGRFLSVGFRSPSSQQAQGAILYVTGITMCDYGIPVRCSFAGFDSTDAPLIVFGSDDGYVYQSDVGRNFDGAAIQAFARLVFHHSRSPARRKRYRFGQLDIESSGPTSLTVGVDYSFANPDEPGNPTINANSDGGGGFWNVDAWNEFRWNAGVVASARFKLEGAGQNIGLLMTHEATDELPHTLHGLVLAHSLRRMDRSS